MPRPKLKKPRVETFKKDIALGAGQPRFDRPGPEYVGLRAGDSVATFKYKDRRKKNLGLEKRKKAPLGRARGKGYRPPKKKK